MLTLRYIKYINNQFLGVTKMKAVKLFSKAVALSSLVAISATSQAFTIGSTGPSYMLDDNYIGGDDHGYKDVIGKPELFDTLGLNVAYSGSIITVDIFTSFATDSAINSYKSLTKNGLGIGSGDLFLSNSYSPFGSPSYLNDNASNGNLWTYGLSIDDPHSKIGGRANLYALNGSTNDANALLSDDFLKTTATFRNGQEVRVDTASSDTSEILSANGTWTVNTDAQKISFSFDASGTNLFDTGSLALHWGMLCGNDVIEGVVAAPTVNVSEPSIAALFGLGLLGLGLARRRV